jgi:3-amino-5-hydroxybenzoic acid synthesis related protein
MTARLLSAFVFDFDGVLLDSEDLMRHALEKSFREHVGRGSPPYDGFFARMGKPLDEILRALGLPPEMASSYRRASREALSMCSLFAGAVEALAAARAQGMKIALLTGKDRSRTLEILERFGIDGAFGAVVCGDDPLRSKPSPDGLLAILRTLGVSPSRAAMLGDSPVDMACARAAGVLPLGAAWGAATSAELSAEGARIVFPDLWAVGRWLEGAAALEGASVL